MPEIEIIDCAELAKRWRLPESWVRGKVKPSRTPTAQQIPHVQLGRYVRFDWASPELAEWIAKQRC